MIKYRSKEQIAEMLSRENPSQNPNERLEFDAGEGCGNASQLENLCVLLEKLTQENKTLKAEISAQKEEYINIISSLLNVHNKVSLLGEVELLVGGGGAEIQELHELVQPPELQSSETFASSGRLTVKQRPIDKNQQITFEIIDAACDLILNPTKPHLDLQCAGKSLVQDGMDSLPLNRNAVQILIEAIQEIGGCAKQYIPLDADAQAQIAAEVTAIACELEKLTKNKISYKSIQAKELMLDGDYASIHIVLKSAKLNELKLGDLTFRLAVAGILQNGPMRFPRVEIHPAKNSDEYPLSGFSAAKESHLDHYEIRFDTEANELDIGAFDRLDVESQRVLLAILDFFEEITAAEKLKSGQNHIALSNWRVISERITMLANKYLTRA